VNYEEYIKSTIIDPLKAKMFFKIDSSQSYAFGYQKRYTLMSAAMGFFLDENKFIESKEEDWLKFKPFYNNGAPYGGLIGNATAFNLYMQELMREDSKIVSEDSKSLMLTATEESKGRMTLSWFTGVLEGHRYFCHAGGGGGHYCEIRFYPDLNVSSVIMLNRSGMKDERLLDKTDGELLRQVVK
jgi:D-alanyl-D-alanine carboxypeptidase